MASWTTDLGDMPPRGARGVPKAGQERAEFTREVVEAATSRRSDGPWTSAVACIARAGRKRCGGRIQVEHRVDRGTVSWSCCTCGEEGIVTGYAGGESDMSRYVPQGREVLWGVDDEQRAVLLEATVHIPELRAVIARTSPYADMPGLLLIRATVNELDEMYTLVEELTDCARSRKRHELLDDLRRTLSTSIDGF